MFGILLAAVVFVCLFVSSHPLMTVNPSVRRVCFVAGDPVGVIILLVKTNAVLLASCLVSQMDSVRNSSIMQFIPGPAINPAFLNPVYVHNTFIPIS